MKLNKMLLNTMAAAIANGGDNIEVDVAAIEDEDDAIGVLSHLDILERNVDRLRQEIRGQLSDK